jgi:hypothetical protein
MELDFLNESRDHQDLDPTAQHQYFQPGSEAEMHSRPQYIDPNCFKCFYYLNQQKNVFNGG